MRSLSRFAYWGLSVAVLAALLGLTLLSCEGLETTDGGVPTTGTSIPGSDDAGLPEPPPSIEVTIPSVTLPAPPTTEALSTTSEERLPNGHIKACGKIDDVWVDGGVRKLRIDYVDFLTGAEADAAAIEDGVIPPGEHVDNDYYVRNNNPRLRVFNISDTAEIYTEYRNMLVEVQPCSWTDFLGFWGDAPLPQGDTHLPDALWWIERDGDTIVWIRHQFVP